MIFVLNSFVISALLYFTSIVASFFYYSQKLFVIYESVLVLVALF